MSARAVSRIDLMFAFDSLLGGESLEGTGGAGTRRRPWSSGAEASCAVYSVVTTVGACGLDDRSHVEWLLSEMPNDPVLRVGGADISRYLP